MPRVAKIERKTEYFPCIGEMKEFNDTKGIIGGYLNYINNIDYGDDRTMPGAFHKTLTDSYARKNAQRLDFLWPYLWNHDYSIIPPGGIYDADEDKNGLYTKTQFNLDMQMGRELYSSFKMGTMKKQSMGYKAIQVDWVKEENKSIRNLVEVAVMEGSAVVFPMNDMAQVDTVKRYWQGYRAQEKGKTMDIWSKDYAESYQQTNQQDWVSDLWNLWYPLRNEIITAFQTGDTVIEDVTKALDQFSAATLAYMQQGIALDMMECLQPDNNSMPSYMMSSDDNPETKDESKAGRMISAANHAKLKAAAEGINKHVATIHSVLKHADPASRQNTLSGYQVYSAPTDELEGKDEDEGKQAGDEDEASKQNGIREGLYDLAAKLQFENASKGI
jgi:HK97 family phage prohead protease